MEEKDRMKVAKQWLRDQVKWEVINPEKPGGQSCGIPQYRQVLISEDLAIRIEVGYHRSTIKNRELAMTLFDLAMDDIVK